VKIRDAVDSDLASILDIYNDAIEHTTAVFDDTPHTLDARCQWFVAKQKAALPVFVAVESEAVIGFATYGPFRPWPGYKYSVEHSVYVHPGARRCGVGTALVSAIVDEARSRDLHAIVAGIATENEVSTHLHKRLGFREVGHLVEVGYKFGRWLDLTLLQLSLTDANIP